MIVSINCKWLLITKSTRLYTPSCIQFCEKDTESGVLFSCLNLHGRVPKRSKGKTEALLMEIEDSNLSDTEKDFLRKAAQRHNQFNYKRIAEYYANASAEMQDLMERSALVIIDYDDAIKNGYVQLSSSLEEILGDENDGQ